MNQLKLLIVLPFLAVFLFGFNTEKIYETENSISAVASENGKSIELIIDKNTTDEELEKIKKDLAKDDIDFSYTVVRNDNKEIIDISVDLKGKSSSGENFSGNYSTNSEGPIKPLNIFYDDEANAISFGNSGIHSRFGSSFHKKIKVHKGHSDDKMVWASSSKGEETKEIIIKNVDGKEVVIIDGKEATEEELEEMEIHVEDGTHLEWDSDDAKKHVRIKKIKKGDGENVFIIKDSDEDADIEVISKKGNGFFFIDTDSKEKPLYFIDGKKASEKEVKALSPDEVESINVRKGDGATKKYGKKAKNGVVEITTKKKN